MFSIKTSKGDFPKRTGRRFKVVINSGGGVFGYIISNFMSYLDFDLYSKVDLVSGTSIGGILALAYCLDPNYKWINKLFKLASYKIFEDKKSVVLNGIKYDNKNLKRFLEKIYEDKKLSDIKNHVLITTTDFTLRIPRIFENIHLKPEQDLPLVDLGLFTSAAPTFFKAHQYPWKTLDYDLDEVPVNEKILIRSALKKFESNQDDKYSILFDGGVLENIPIMSTYAALHTEYGVLPQDIDMFIIGAGDRRNTKKYTLQETNKWSILETLKNLIVPYVVESNVQTSLYWGMQMGFNYFRYYNPIEIEGEMDNLAMIPRIESQCLEHKDEFLSEISEFLDK